VPFGADLAVFLRKTTCRFGLNYKWPFTATAVRYKYRSSELELDR